MRIQHNILAMNAYRNYNNNTAALGKNLEKLSSGYKINRAGDDAAGLAISEKMRAQITGLNAAQKNVKDGVSLVKTAEGAMQEIQDMLNRMDYLATQSANGTYDNEVDRANLQKEVDALKTEINRIADSANFNGIKLLDGSLDSTVNETTTEYTSGKNNVPILQDIASDPTAEVGSKTVLHVNGATVDSKTEFKVELHNTNLVGAHGDTVSVKIGDQTLNFTFDKNVSSNTATAGKLKVGAVSADDLAAAVKKAWDELSSKQIGGQEFNVTATSGTLSFTQATTPTHAGEVVAPCKDVTVEFSSNNKEATFSGILNAAQKNALAASDKIVIDDKEYTFTLANSASTVTQQCGDYFVKYEAGKLTVTNTAGTSAPSSVKIAKKDAATNVTGASAGVGAAASAAVGGNISIGASAFNGVSSTKITFYNADGTSISIAVSSNGQINGSATTASVTINGVTYTIQVAASNATAFTLTAVDKGTAANQGIVYSIEQSVTSGGAQVTATAVSSATISGGVNESGGKATFHVTAASVNVGETIEFNGAKFTVKTSVQDTLKEIAAFANSAFGDLYEVEANGETLTLTAKTTNNGTTAAGQAVIKIGGVDEVDISDALDRVPAHSEQSGTWNIKTTENKSGAVSGGGVLASSTFKLNSGIVKDKNTLTIGNKTYTFKVGKNGTGTGDNVIDLSDFEEGDDGLIAAAAERLSQTTHDVFTIGYDKAAGKEGIISIHEKKGQTVYTNGELSDLKSFDELVYFNSVKDETVTEVTTAKGNALVLQIGDTSDEWNQMKVSVGDMHTKAMAYTDDEGNESTIADIDISSQDGAAAAVNVIKGAINYVSGVRGDLGAIQNRLEHTQNNLSVMAENIQDAESTIRDTDVAEEMMSYVKNNILVQSAQAMLAQANQVPQGVLQLLG